MECAPIILRVPEIVRLAEGGQLSEAGALRAVLGDEARAGKLLAHDFGPDLQRPQFAFLATGATEDCGGEALAVRRSLVWLNLAPAVLVAFDLAVSRGGAVRKRWVLEGLERAEVRGRLFSGTVAVESPRCRVAGATLLPEPGNVTAAAAGIEASPQEPRVESLFLSAIQLLEADGAPLPVSALSSVDLTGVRLGSWVVLFHKDLAAARSPLFFRVEGSGPLRFVVAGLAPGLWELWRDGWMENTGIPVRSQALYFEGSPGEYFLRRFS